MPLCLFLGTSEMGRRKTAPETFLFMVLTSVLFFHVSWSLRPIMIIIVVVIIRMHLLPELGVLWLRYLIGIKQTGALQIACTLKGQLQHVAFVVIFQCTVAETKVSVWEQQSVAVKMTPVCICTKRLSTVKILAVCPTRLYSEVWMQSFF